jgi:hypothetical protein
LKDWLDPGNSGVQTVAGADPSQATIIRPAGTILQHEYSSPTNGAIDPGETVTVSFGLTNLGGVPTTNLVATLLATNGVLFPGPAQDFGQVGGSGVVWRSFQFTTSGACGGVITATLALQDGSRTLPPVTFPINLGQPVWTPLLIENFDSVTPPALPPGWTSFGPGWGTTAANADSPPNAVFATDYPSASDDTLVSPAVTVASSNAQLTFRHTYDLEDGYDGGVLEVSIDNGVFTDALNAGATFGANGYNGTISSYYGNPLAGRQAWTGNSGGYLTTSLNLPAAASGHNVQFRWRLGTDNGTGATGWTVDTIALTQLNFVCGGSVLAPVLVEPQWTRGGFIFSCNTVGGQTYFLETATNLAYGHWTALATNAGNGSMIWFTNVAAQSPRAFRVRTE